MPLVGSMMAANGLLLLSTLCEKSPLRSSAVGTTTFLAVFGTNCNCHSWLQKKKMRFFGNIFGMRTGPPNVYPGSLYRYNWRGRLLALFNQVFALNSSCR